MHREILDTLKQREIFYRSLVTNIDKDQRKKLIEYEDVTVSLSQKSNSCANAFSGHGYRRDSLSQNLVSIEYLLLRVLNWWTLCSTISIAGVMLR